MDFSLYPINKLADIVQIRYGRRAPNAVRWLLLSAILIYNKACLRKVINGLFHVPHEPFCRYCRNSIQNTPIKRVPQYGFSHKFIQNKVYFTEAINGYSHVSYKPFHTFCWNSIPKIWARRRLEIPIVSQACARCFFHRFCINFKWEVFTDLHFFTAIFKQASLKAENAVRNFVYSIMGDTHSSLFKTSFHQPFFEARMLIPERP
jgi:hypothetical protein